MRLSRVFLLGVIVTLCVAALMGLAAVLAVNVNGRLIATDLLVSFCSLTCLGATIPRHRNRWRMLQPLAFVFSALGLVTTLLLVWDVFSYPTSRPVGKLAGASMTWAVAIPALLLLAMTRFTDGLRWVRWTVLGLIVLLATQLSLAILLELHGDIGERFMAANAILASLGVVALPILHKLYGARNPVDLESARAEMEIICPRCGAHQTIPQGDSSCSACHLQFHIQIEEPRCPGCGYLLYKLPGPQCPECGRVVAQPSVPATPPSP